MRSFDIQAGHVGGRMTIIAAPRIRSSHAAPVGGQSSAAAHDASALLDAVYAKLSESPTGARIVADLKRHHVPINVLPDEAAHSRMSKGALAEFDPRTGRITVPLSVMTDAEQGALLLAHEGTHANDWYSEHSSRIGGLVSTAFGSVGSALLAPFHLENPATAAVDHSRRKAMDDEVRAYTAQAHVEDELGVPAYFMADYGHTDSGAIATPEAIRSQLAEIPLYQDRGGMRVVRAGSMALLLSAVSLLAVDGAALLLRRELPVVPFAALAGAAAIGMTVQDWATH